MTPDASIKCCSANAVNSHANIGGGFHPPDPTRTLNDLSAKWVSESGLFELASSSKLPAARAFRKWVFGEVLPSIRQTGSYSVQAAAPAAKQTDTWLDKRLEGKELMRLKNASLQELIAGAFGRIGPKLYAITGNLFTALCFDCPLDYSTMPSSGQHVNWGHIVPCIVLPFPQVMVAVQQEVPCCLCTIHTQVP